MSSDTDGVYQSNGWRYNVHYVRFLDFRAPSISGYMQTIDDEGSKEYVELPSKPRIRNTADVAAAKGANNVFSKKRRIPFGKPKAIYDAQWLAQEKEKYEDFTEEVMEVSQEAFELLEYIG
jgi:hypothetical protein